MIRQAPYNTKNPLELQRQLAALELEVVKLARSAVVTETTETAEASALWRTDFANVRTETAQWGDDFRIDEITGAAVTLDGASSNVNHPGILLVTSAVAINTGVVVSAGQFQLAGDEYTVCVFRTPAALATWSLTSGFFDNRASTTETTNGAYLWVNNSNVLQGKTADGGVRSVTSTTYALAVTTWYTGIVRVNADKTLVRYYLYSDAGELLWSSTLSLNLPGTVALYCGHKHANTSAAAIQSGAIDYLEARIGGPARPLVRYLGSAADAH